MLTKITFRKILFIAVLLLIIPMIMSAAGNREADNGNGITLDDKVMVFLDDLGNGKPLEETKEAFISLEKEYKVSEDQRELVFNMMEQVKSGVLKPEDCQKQLQEQLGYTYKYTNQNQSETQDGTAVITQSKKMTTTMTQSKSSTSENSSVRKNQ
ncbi:MAG: hypothetical protein J7L71_04220 [Spirochaetaceae bacterium]|nr:hypothetical protein [Spirochaetaceae bacterium]